MDLPSWSVISTLRPSRLSSMMTFLEISLISGMSCRAWRKVAAASAKSRSSFARVAFVRVCARAGFRPASARPLRAGYGRRS